MDEDTESDQSTDGSYGSDTSYGSDGSDSYGGSYESAGSGEGESEPDSDTSDGSDTSYGSYGSDTGGGYESDGNSEGESDTDASLGVEDASFVHPPSEWGQRVGQFWSGVGDWAGGTASSAVHLGEWAWDSATGDEAAAHQREADMSQDWNQITHGIEEIADLM